MEGRAIDFAPIKARYVRYYQHGAWTSDYANPDPAFPHALHACEIEVYAPRPTVTFDYDVDGMENDVVSVDSGEKVSKPQDPVSTPGTKENTANVKFVGELSIPEGYSIKQAGLIWSSKSEKEVELIVDADTDDPKLNTSLKPTYITKISDTNQFSVTMKKKRMQQNNM